MDKGDLKRDILVGEFSPENDMSEPFPQPHPNEVIFITSVNAPECGQYWSQKHDTKDEGYTDPLQSISDDKTEALPLNNQKTKKTCQYIKKRHSKLEDKECYKLIDRIAMVLASTPEHPVFREIENIHVNGQPQHHCHRTDEI